MADCKHRWATLAGGRYQCRKCCVTWTPEKPTEQQYEAAKRCWQWTAARIAMGDEAFVAMVEQAHNGRWGIRA